MLDQNVRVRSCASARELSSVLADDPRAVVVLDLAAGTGECLQFLRSLPDVEGTPAIVAIASPETKDLEWPARELGASAFLVDPVSGDDLAQFCRRQL